MSGFDENHLRELTSFQELEAMTSEVKAITSYKVDNDDSASLERRLRDIDRLKQLDLSLARQAFRLELVEAGEDFLPIASRLSLLEGFNPERLQAQQAARDADLAELELLRKTNPWQYNHRVGAISIGGISIASEANPMGIARRIEYQLLRVQESVQKHAPGAIGFRTGKDFFVGRMEDENVLRFVEPSVARDDETATIEYEIPTRLHGITNIEQDVPHKGKDFDPTAYGSLFTEEDGEVIAHPHLESVANALRVTSRILLETTPYFGENAIISGSYNTSFDRNPPRRNNGLITTTADRRRMKTRRKNRT